MEVTRVFDLLPYQLEKFPKEDAFSMKVKGQWVKYSTKQFSEIATDVSRGLYEIGVRKDDKVAIISHNRVEWNLIDYGIQQLGAISVPMYPTITEEDYRFIFQDAGVKVVFVSTQDLYDKVQNALKGISGIEHIYTFEHIPGAQHWTEIKKLGEGKDRAVIEEAKKAVTPSDVLTLIYTSG